VLDRYSFFSVARKFIAVMVALVIAYEFDDIWFIKWSLVMVRIVTGGLGGRILFCDYFLFSDSFSGTCGLRLLLEG